MVDIKKLFKVSRDQMGNWTLKVKDAQGNHSQVTLRGDEDGRCKTKGTLQL